jgi:rubrerythrin
VKNFNDLSEREVLALAISLEEEGERVYADFAEGLKDNYPASGSLFDAMRKEESNHRRRLLDLYCSCPKPRISCEHDLST